LKRKKEYIVPKAVIPAKGAARPPALPLTATGTVPGATAAGVAAAAAAAAAAPALPETPPPVVAAPAVDTGEHAADPSAAAASDVPKEDEPVWAVATAESGQEYYYHTITGEVTWDKPADFVG